MKNDYWVIMGRWSRDGKAEQTKLAGTAASTKRLGK